MANFLVATDAPTIFKMGEKEYVFPVWQTCQWIPVLAALLQKRIDTLGKYLKQTKVPPNEAAYYLMQEECRVPDANDAHAYSLTLEGMDRVLRDSLVRGGVSEPEATTVVNAIPTKHKYNMVINVACVYEPRETSSAAKSVAKNDGMGFGDQGQTAPEQPDTLGGSQPAPANPPTSPSP